MKGDRVSKRQSDKETSELLIASAVHAASMNPCEKAERRRGLCVSSAYKRFCVFVHYVNHRTHQSASRGRANRG